MVRQPTGTKDRRVIGEYCKRYRASKGVTLKSLVGEDRAKTVSAFENGRSTNVNHLSHYLKLAAREGDLSRFVLGIYIASIQPDL